MRVPSDTYKVKDGGFLNITVVNERHWAPFCRALDQEKWIDDPCFSTMHSRVKNRKELSKLIAARFAERTMNEWLPHLEAARIPFAPVNDYAQALADPQIGHRNMIHSLDHPESGPTRVLGPPWVMTGNPVKMKPPPLLDQHLEEVLRGWLGWDEEKIKRFRAESSD